MYRSTKHVVYYVVHADPIMPRPRAGATLRPHFAPEKTRLFPLHSCERACGEHSVLILARCGQCGAYPKPRGWDETGDRGQYSMYVRTSLRVGSDGTDKGPCSHADFCTYLLYRHVCTRYCNVPSIRSAPLYIVDGWFSHLKPATLP